MSNKLKQVIVVRKDLNMRKGKLAAQVAHATQKILLDSMVEASSTAQGRIQITMRQWNEFKQWFLEGSTKIVLGVENEESLVALYDAAASAGLKCAMITDSGRTEFHGVPTRTCVAIGPDSSDKVDNITGNLPLL